MSAIRAKIAFKVSRFKYSSPATQVLPDAKSIVATIIIMYAQHTVNNPI